VQGGEKGCKGEKDMATFSFALWDNNVLHFSPNSCTTGRQKGHIYIYIWPVLQLWDRSRFLFVSFPSCMLYIYDQIVRTTCMHAAYMFYTTHLCFACGSLFCVMHACLYWRGGRLEHQDIMRKLCIRTYYIYVLFISASYVQHGTWCNSSTTGINSFAECRKHSAKP
jgi:hypothetical protein